MRNMKKLIGLLVLVMAVSGCENKDASGLDPICTSECTANYSKCASGGSEVGVNAETVKACKEAYSMCIDVCPTE